MKDFVGNKLEVGDEVIFVTCMEDTFNIGKVSKITENTIMIKTGWKYRPQVQSQGEEVIKVVRE